MIEVNILPGGRKRSAKGGRFSLNLPDLSILKGIKLPKGDPWTLGAAAAVTVALLASGWFVLSVAGDADEVEAQIEVAVADSTRFAGIMARSAVLQARSDTIGQQVQIIQEIDQARYVWPHLIDEVGRATPDYVWMTRMGQLSGGDPIAFQIEGRAGTMLAMSTFMETLEASPYVRSVELVSSLQSTQGAQQFYEFVLDMQSEPPSADLIQRVPLFTDEPGAAGGGT